MREIRLAKKGEIDHQKEIWKLCFGDADKYIDLYYAYRYKEEETALLLESGEIAAMLTMIPVRMVTPDNRSFDAAMLYAIAAHPQYQNKGFAAQLLDFTNQYLTLNNKVISLLVPGEKHLFNYYSKQGYRDGFYHREILLTRDMIERLTVQASCPCSLSVITPREYNRRRNKLSEGRLYISYADEDIAYQKKLSQQSGAEIYALDFADMQGCVAIERMTPDKVLIKELLLPEELINVAIKQIVQFLNAKEYILRTPMHLGKYLGGTMVPFGMYRVHRDLDFEITSKVSGYLGLAFD